MVSPIFPLPCTYALRFPKGRNCARLGLLCFSLSSNLLAACSHWSSISPCVTAAMAWRSSSRFLLFTLGSGILCFTGPAFPPLLLLARQAHKLLLNPLCSPQSLHTPMLAGPIPVSITQWWQHWCPAGDSSEMVFRLCAMAQNPQVNLRSSLNTETIDENSSTPVLPAMGPSID